MTSSKRLALITLPLIALAVVFAYSDVRTHAFVNLDDDVYVTDNAFVRSGLGARSIAWAFTTTLGGHYHPLTWLSLMLDVSLAGVDAPFMASVNVALHFVVTLFVFALALTLTKSTAASLIASALFALHPARVESVAWVTERKDVLASAFGFAALWLFTADGGKARRVAGCVLFACALLAKPTWVVLPLLLLWSRPRREPVVIGVLVALSLIASAYTLYGQGREHAIVEAELWPLWRRACEASVNAVRTLGLLAWPRELSVFYERTASSALVIAGSVLVNAALLAAAFFTRRTRPHVAFAIGWFYLAFIPVSGIIQAGGQSIAARFSYLPSVGLAIGLGVEAARRRATAALVVPLACGLVFATRSEVAAWRSSTTLFRHALAAAGPSFFVHNNLGAALDAEGRTDEAFAHYAEAVRLNPTYPEANNNYGSLLARRGDLAGAVPYFERAVAVRPSFARAQYHLGLALYALRGEPMWSRAEAALLRAEQLSPDDPDVRTTLAAFRAERARLNTR